MNWDQARRARGLFASALGAGLLLAGIASAQEPVTIRASYETPEQHIKSRTFVAFKEAIEEISDGYYEVELYPSAQLMGPSDEVAATARGQLEMSAPYFSYLASVEPMMNIYQAPLVFSSYDQLWRFLETEEADALAALLEERRLQPASYWFENPTRLWSKEPIRELADVEGKKVRTVPSDILQDGVEAMGAQPTAIPGTELYLALQQGVADAAFSAPNYGLSMKYNEVATYHTKLDLFYGGYFVLFNKPWFDEQPAERQEQLMEAAAQARAFNEENVREDLAGIDEDLADAGVEVIEISDEELAAFREALQPLYESLDPEMRELIEVVRGLE